MRERSNDNFYFSSSQSDSSHKSSIVIDAEDVWISPQEKQFLSERAPSKKININFNLRRQKKGACQSDLEDEEEELFEPSEQLNNSFRYKFSSDSMSQGRGDLSCQHLILKKPTKQQAKREKEEAKGKKEAGNQVVNASKQHLQTPEHGIKSQASPRNLERKARLSITPAILKELNEAFNAFNPNKKCSPSNFDGPPHLFSLKSISEYMNLSYTTIRHKYNDYKEKMKLDAPAKETNRKYQRSFEAEQLIQKAFQEKIFKNTGQLTAYIDQHYGWKLSRTAISRHLSSLGFSIKNGNEIGEAARITYLSKNMHNSCKQLCFNHKVLEETTRHLQADQNNAIKQQRNKHLQFVLFNMRNENTKIYYLAELQFAEVEFKKPQLQIKTSLNQKNVTPCLSVILFATIEDGIYRYGIQTKVHTAAAFQQFFIKTVNEWKIPNSQNMKLVIMDLRETHRSKRMLQFRDQSRGSNIIFVYLPPASEELNYASHILNKVQKEVGQTLESGSVETLKKLEACMEVFADSSLKHEAKEFKKIIVSAFNELSLAKQ